MREAVQPLFSAEEIKQRVKELAREISKDYQGKSPLLIGVLKGCWIFLADLVREITIPISVDFMMVSSYGKETKSSGKIKIVLDLAQPLEGKDVLVVDDILDTGLTTKFLLNQLQVKRPVSLKLCVLLDKPSRRRVQVQPDYVGFVVPNQFIVGYGIDFAENYRHLPYIGYIKNNEKQER